MLRNKKNTCYVTFLGRQHPRSLRLLRPPASWLCYLAELAGLLVGAALNVAG